MNLKYYFSSVKSISGLHQRIVADLTKGDVFRYSIQECAERKERATEEAWEFIRDQLNTIPKKIKRDVAVQ